MAGDRQETTFECLDQLRTEPHTFAAELTDQGRVVEFDGQRKLVTPPSLVPNSELMGNEEYFGSHEHCIRHAHTQVEAVLKSIETDSTSAALGRQTNELLELGLATGATADDLLIVHALGRALESGDPERMRIVAGLAGLTRLEDQER